MVYVSQCCCGCSLRTGTIIISIFCIIGGLMELIFSAMYLDNSKSVYPDTTGNEFFSGTNWATYNIFIRKWLSGIILFLSLVLIIVSIVTLVNVFMDGSPTIFMPFIIFVLLYALVYALLIIAASSMTLVDAKEVQAYKSAYTGILLMCLGHIFIDAILTCLVALYFALVVYSYYQDLQYDYYE